jgi:hypothetical protein
MTVETVPASSVLTGCDAGRSALGEARNRVGRPKTSQKKSQKKCASNRVGLLLPIAAARQGPLSQRRKRS